MALSNKFGWLVLTTGNKSEMSVGYSTLYGDSAGGFAVIKDVPKLLVYRLARHRDERAGGGLVPPELVTRPPSAELRPDQRDDDSLPPYEILDAILEGYVEHDLGREQLIARGLPRRRRRPRHPPRRPRRVQAPPAAARASRSRRAPSAATGACRSPTATAAEPRPAPRPAAAAPRSSSASARRGGPASSVISTSQIHVVRPRWRRSARAWIVPVDDRAQERRLVGRAHRRVALGHDDDRRAERRERLGDRREDAAVDEPERLAQLVADGDLGAHELVGELEHLEAVERVEAAGRRRSVGSSSQRTLPMRSAERTVRPPLRSAAGR